MIQDNNNALHFNADEGKTFVHKETSARYGNDLYLSPEDSISNYTEEPMTDEEKVAIENAKKAQDETKDRQVKTSKKSKK